MNSIRDFDDTYPLYKYNIGIDYHHIKISNKERHTKEREIIKEVNSKLDCDDTYTLYNTGIDFHHIRNRDNERYTKKENVK